MIRGKRHIFNWIGCFLIPVLCIVLIQFCERTIGLHRNEKFRDYATLLGPEGMITKGWIPDFIPKDAEDIRIDWDLDSNEVYATFTTDTPLSGPCQRLSSPPSKFERWLNISTWWKPPPKSKTGVKWYTCTRNDHITSRAAHFAYDPAARRMWMYSD